MRQYFAGDWVDMDGSRVKESIVASDDFRLPEAERQHIRFEINELTHVGSHCPTFHGLPKFVQERKKDRMLLDTVNQYLRVYIDRTFERNTCQFQSFRSVSKACSKDSQLEAECGPAGRE